MAKSKSYRIIRSPRIQSFLTEALEKLGVTPELIVQPVLDALQATRIVAVKGPDGEIHLDTGYPDHRIRLEAYDRAERLYGVTLTKQEVPPPAKGSLTVVIVRASDLQRAVAAQNAEDITPGQVSSQPRVLDVEIVRRTTGAQSEE